jgi:hypothetical protein
MSSTRQGSRMLLILLVTLLSGAPSAHAIGGYLRVCLGIILETRIGRLATIY